MSMSHPNLADLLGRLEQLEKRNEGLARQNRRLLGGAAVAVAAVAAALLLQSLRPGRAVAEPQQSQARALEADRLTLHDGNGKTRAELAMGAQGPALLFYDEAGKPRGGFGLGPNGSTIRLLGENGRAMTGLSVERGGVALSYVDEAGQIHVGNEALKTDPGFSLSDERPRPTRPGTRP